MLCLWLLTSCAFLQSVCDSLDLALQEVQVLYPEADPVLEPVGFPLFHCLHCSESPSFHNLEMTRLVIIVPAAARFSMLPIHFEPGKISNLTHDRLTLLAPINCTPPSSNTHTHTHYPLGNFSDKKLTTKLLKVRFTQAYTLDKLETCE